MTIYLQNGQKIENVTFIQERVGYRGHVYFYILSIKMVDGEEEFYKIYNLHAHEIKEIKIEIS